MSIKEAFADFLSDCVDLKYQLVAISTLLFYYDKLSEMGWITCVLSLCGVRLLDNVGSLVKGKISDAVTPTVKGKKR